MTDQGISVSQGDVVERLRSNAFPGMETMREFALSIIAERDTTIASLREQVERRTTAHFNADERRCEAESRVSVLEGVLAELIVAYQDAESPAIQDTIRRGREALRSLPVNAGSTSSDGGRLSDVLTPLPREEADALAPFMKGMSDAPSETRSPDTEAIADADSTPHAFREAGMDTCKLCGNRRDHDVHHGQLPSREAIARIIAPASWKVFDNNPQHHDERTYLEASLKKSDAILSLLDKGGGTTDGSR